MVIIQERRSRQSGTTVQVIDNRDGDFDTYDWGWITVCVEHGNYCSHETRRMAEYFAPFPAEWCDDCDREGVR